MNQVKHPFSQPASTPKWVEANRADEEYFAKQEKARTVWFDFFCINPLTAKFKQTNAKPTNN